MKCLDKCKVTEIANRLFASMGVGKGSRRVFLMGMGFLWKLKKIF